jgi:ABC-type sugar transport system ATPase subunit
MNTRMLAGWTTALTVTALFLVGCGRKAVRTASQAPSGSSLPQPMPPSGAIENLRLPESDGKGGYRTVNSDLSTAEAMWHLRSALNVAALTCDRNGTLGLAANYNRLLGRQRRTLAAAYRAEGTRFGSAAATDTHVTQVYNFFAQPPAQARFCTAAATVAAEAAAVPTEKLSDFAPAALDRLTAPFTDFYRDYARYQVALADWKKGDHAPGRPAVAGGAARADLRAARAERRGQVDADQHPRRASSTRPSGQRDDLGLRHRSHPRNAKASIGIVPQEILFDPFFTPRETLEIQAGSTACRKAQRRPMELLRAVHLEDKADAYARTLSGGMKRRLLVAKAMVHSPPVLVLDEPTAGVDIELRQQLWAYVRELNGTA